MQIMQLDGYKDNESRTRQQNLCIDRPFNIRILSRSKNCPVIGKTKLVELIVKTSSGKPHTKPKQE